MLSTFQQLRAFCKVPRVFSYRRIPSQIERTQSQRRTLFGLWNRASEPAEPLPGALTIKNNPWKAKRQWPPDFSKVPPKHQFRLERKYRRRSKLKWARPTYMKVTKLLQWGMIGAFVLYCIFFMKAIEGEEVPFKGLRGWISSQFEEFLPTSDPQEKKELPSR